MNKEILINIKNKDVLENFEEVFISDAYKMADIWKELNNDLLFMSISEKTEVKIREILNTIGEEMVQICELMIKENNK